MFLSILTPIVVTQIALSLMNVVDTMMSGQYHHTDLAGVAIGSSLWLPVYTGISGILLALTPIIAQHVGARRQHEIGGAVVQGVYLSIALAAVTVAAGALLLDPILNMMALEAPVRAIAKKYVHALAWGIVPLFAYTVFRCFIDAMGQTRMTMFITVLSLPVNVVLNYALIFGKAGLPQLGGVGAGYASAITYWFIMIIAVVVIVKRAPFRQLKVFHQFGPPRFSLWKEQLLIGVPIGMAIFSEVSIFSAVAVLMSAFGTIPLAAHQAAINFSSLLYMIPLSISMALTIAVGFETGAQRPEDARQYTGIGLTSSLSIALLWAVGLIIFRDTVAQLYSPEPEVYRMAGSFLFYAIFFQMSDAVAAPIQGALRGYKDVNVTLALSLVAYWVIGLPFGYVLANFTNYGPHGYWLGLVSGLAAGAIGLAFRLRYVQRTPDAGVALPVVTAQKPS